MRTLRSQCQPCPWRDLDWMLANYPSTIEHARTNPDGFVCHTRCGPCDGPRHAEIVAVRADPEIRKAVET